MKRAYLLDSTTIISQEAAEQDNIMIQPSNIIINDKEYKDIIEISGKEFYQAMENKAKTSTSQIPAGAFLASYEQLKADGVTEVFVFTISSGVSGTYQSAVMAKDMIDGIDIYVLDTKFVGAIIHLLVREIIAMEDKPAAEIVAYLNERFTKMELYAYIGDFSRLKEGGRLSASQAMIGSLLKINLVFNFENGVINVFAKERKATNAINRIITEIKNRKAANDETKRVVFLETTKPEYREKLENAYNQAFPEDHSKSSNHILSPAIGSHVGTEVAMILLEWE